MIKIYGVGPTRWSKCIWMARELGIPFEEVVVPFNGNGFGDANYLKLNPFGAVPALEDDDFKLFESHAIINYLGEKHPEKNLVPKSGTRERALYDQWMFCSLSTIEGPLWSYFRHSRLFKEPRNTDEINRATAELSRRLAVLEDLIGAKSYLVADRFTAADITMTYTLHWASGYGFLEKFPNLSRYTQLHRSRAAFPTHLYG